MKPNENPFFLRHLECPVCATVNEFETIRVGAYTEEGRDTDFCPTERHWQNPKYEGVNPLLYFIATCDSCFYSRELTSQYREWKSDNTFRTYRQKVIRQKHLNALSDSEGVLRRLGASLWPESYPIPTSINKLLLAILNETMLDEPSELDLGRWYLRIGWLFRERETGGAPQPSPRDQMRRELFRSLEGLHDETAEVRRCLEGIQRLVTDHPESIARTPDDTDGPEEYRRMVEDLAENLESFTGDVDDLAGWLRREESPVMGEATTGDAETYGDYPSYQAFLTSLDTDWPKVPLNEREALSFSLTHYRSVYETGHKIDPGNAQIQIAYLIGELARRVGRHEEAIEYLNNASRLGREWMLKMGHDRQQTALARRIVDLSLEQMQNVRESVRQTA